MTQPSTQSIYQTPEQLGQLLHGITSPVFVTNLSGQILYRSEGTQQRKNQGGFTPEQFSLTLGNINSKKTEEYNWEKLFKNLSPINSRLIIGTDEGTLIITPIKLSEESTIHKLLLIEWQNLIVDERLQLLLDVSKAVNSSLILEDIYESLGDVLIRYIPYQEAVILILDDTQNGIKVLVRIFEDGTLDIEGENNMFAGYDSLVDRVLKRPQPDRFEAGNLPESVVFSQSTNSAIMVPLINKGVVIGLIALSSNDENGYSSHHENLLSEISSQLAVAVENAKFYWQTQNQASREYLINQLTKAIRQSLDIETMLYTAVRELGRVLGASRCFIQYHPDSNGQWESTSDHSVTPKVFEHSLPGIKSLTRPSYDIETSFFQLRQDQKGNPFVLNDTRQCPPQLDKDWLMENNVKSLAVFPILIRDSFVGTMTLHQCDTYRSWVIEDIELLNAVAEHLGVALHQARLFETLDTQKQELEHTLEELQQAQLFLIQSEKMAVLGQFVAGIAHEVNTPLGTIMSNNATLESCFKKIQSGEEDDTERLYSVMNDLLNLNKLASQRISEIVKSLRNFARLDESEMKRVNIHDGIESTLMVMKSSIPRNITIKKEYGSDVPQVDCFPGLLNQVFMNMIVNAVHALDEKEAGTITITSRYNDIEKMVAIRFTDDGKGIEPDHLARIFDPGFTTKGSGLGTGLGLALCYRIVEKHGGTIGVDSTVGEGTTFTVHVPVKLTK